MSRIMLYYPNTIYVSYFFVPLCMPWHLEIHNRIQLGFALGWSYYSKDSEHNYSELDIYLGLIGLTIKY